MNHDAIDFIYGGPLPVTPVEDSDSDSSPELKSWGVTFSKSNIVVVIVEHDEGREIFQMTPAMVNIAWAEAEQMDLWRTLHDAHFTLHTLADVRRVCESWKEQHYGTTTL